MSKLRSRHRGGRARAAELPLLDPRNDVVFKLLLASESGRPVLRFLLEGPLRRYGPIEAFTVLDPEIRPEQVKNKLIRFDVRVRFSNGIEVVVEMQCHREPYFTNRLTFYSARLITEQLPIGEHYGALRPGIVIAFLDFEAFESSDFHSRFRFHCPESGVELSDLQEIHTVELPKIGDALDVDEPMPHDPLVLFSKFLVARTEAELAELAQVHPAMKKAIDDLRKISADDAMRRLAKERDDMRRVTVLLERQARNEEIAAAVAKATAEAVAKGLAEGRAEGRAEGKAEGKAEGRAEGRAESKAESVARVLTRRFGALDDTTRARIAGASLSDLERWFDAAIDADSIESVFATR